MEESKKFSGNNKVILSCSLTKVVFKASKCVLFNIYFAFLYLLSLWNYVVEGYWMKPLMGETYFPLLKKVVYHISLMFSYKNYFVYPANKRRVVQLANKTASL
jgi:hypothetical protein